MTRTVKLGLLIAAILTATATSTPAGFQTQTFDWTMRSGAEENPATFTGFLVLPFKGDGTGPVQDFVVLSTPDIVTQTYGSIDGSLMGWNVLASGNFTVTGGQITSGGFGAVKNDGGLVFTNFQVFAKEQSLYFTLDFSQRVPQGLELPGSTVFTRATPEPGSFTVFGTVFAAAGGWGLFKRRRSKSARV